MMCLCYVHIDTEKLKKLDAKSYKAVLVGYPEGTKGYKVFNVETGKFAKSRNVVFDENKFHEFNEPSPQKDIIFPYDNELDVHNFSDGDNSNAR